MNRRLRASGVLALAVALTLTAGCKAKHEIYINPDGTGKMIVEMASSQPEDVESLLVFTRGVAAWTDVSVKTEGAASAFRGTALFTDLNKTRVGVVVSRNAAGNMVVEVRRPEKSPTSKPDNITDEQIKAKIAELRKSFEKETSRDETKRVSGARWDIRIHVPGDVVSLKQFKQAADGTLEISFQGRKVLDAMTKIMADDKTLTAMIREGESPKDPGQMFDGLLLKELFGSIDPIRAEIRPSDKPLFDYRAAVAAAGNDWLTQALINAGSLPAKLPNPDPTIGEATFEKVAIMSNSHDQTQVIALALVVKPADKNALLTKVELYRMVDGNDTVALPAPGVFRLSVWYGRSPDDGVYRMNITLPAVTTPTIKEIRGVAHAYLVKSTREVDLGIVELKTGASGSAMGFKLVDCEKKDASVSLTCKFDKPYPLTRLVFKDDSGKELKGEDFDATAPRDTRFLYAYGANNWPDKVRIVAVIAEGTKTVDIPFHFKNVKVSQPKEVGAP
jgi:hypothetical protein